MVGLVPNMDRLIVQGYRHYCEDRWPTKIVPIQIAGSGYRFNRLDRCGEGPRRRRLSARPEVLRLFIHQKSHVGVGVDSASQGVRRPESRPICKQTPPSFSKRSARRPGRGKVSPDGLQHQAHPFPNHKQRQLQLMAAP
jgi:hypothetical protein